MKKGIYLGAGAAKHEKYKITYQDINNKRDISGDMLNINLDEYDYIIATPPCNYWSKARGKKLSDYSKNTAHLLPAIITKLIILNKPFIVENVKNIKRMNLYGLLEIKNINIYHIGRHTYWTNIKIDIDKIIQRQDFKYGGHVIKYDDMENKYHQGGFNVYQVIEQFLEKVQLDETINN